MVSPWQQNGNAIQYVKANDGRFDYRELVNTFPAAPMKTPQIQMYRSVALPKDFTFSTIWILLWYMVISKGFVSCHMPMNLS